MLNNLSIRSRLILIISVMSILSVVLTTIGLVGIHFSNTGLQQIYNDRLVPSGQLAEINVLQLDSRLRVNGSLALYAPEENEKSIAQIKENMEKVTELWNSYIKTELTPEEKILVDKFVIDRENYKNEALLPAIEFIKTGDDAELRKLIVEKFRPLFLTVSEDIKKLIDLQLRLAKEGYQDAQSRYKVILIGSLIALILGLGSCIFLGLAIIRNLTNAMKNAQEMATAIANGNLNSQIMIEGNDEITVLLKAMQMMQFNLKALVEDVNELVSAALKGNFSSKINIQGKNGFNKEVSEALNKLSEITNTSLHDVIRVTDALSKGDLSQKITQDYKGLFGLTAKGVNESVDSLSKIIKEIEELVDSGANHGNFSYKINMNGKVGYTKTVAELLNQLSNVTEGALNEVNRVTTALANGDLTHSITNDYVGIFNEVKVSINNTTENLQNLMTEIKETTNVIAAASTEIAAGNNDLAHRTEEQAAALEQTAASMHELTSTVEHNSENAKQANHLAVGAMTIANKGVTVVQDVVNTMDNINESSLRIVDIISVIDDIAFQTNILALNAAVEAARAGDQGKGFAVVATEVRNLAQRAANAAGEIKRLIGDSVERVSGGSKQVSEAGQTMQDIVVAIQNVNKIISEIASASTEQSEGISQVGQSISSMDDVTQQNAALVEQVAATAESLENQTQNLAKELGYFKTNANKQTKVVTKPKSVAQQTKSAPISTPKSVNTFSVGNDDWEEF
jgi:methyl-accepting chemotaxis protein